MSKKSVISLSIFGIIIALTGVLFGAVFRLRLQSVSVIERDVVEITKSEVFSASGLKMGQSIFMIDKDKAITNIEAKLPYVKVVQIKTTSLTEVNIVLRSRHELFYTEFDDKFLILDEDLKVLKIETEEPAELVHIEIEDIENNENIEICNFVGSNQERKATYALYRAVLNNVKRETDDKTEYYKRADICEIIDNVKFEQAKTYNKIIITTKHGVKFDIENPTNNLTNKMNICLSTMNKFIADGEDKEKSGTIKIYFNEDNVQKNVYIP